MVGTCIMQKRSKISFHPWRWLKIPFLWDTWGAIMCWLRWRGDRTSAAVLQDRVCLLSHLWKYVCIYLWPAAHLTGSSEGELYKVSNHHHCNSILSTLQWGSQYEVVPCCAWYQNASWSRLNLRGWSGFPRLPGPWASRRGCGEW